MQNLGEHLAAGREFVLLRDDFADDAQIGKIAEVGFRNFFECAFETAGFGSFADNADRAGNVARGFVRDQLAEPENVNVGKDRTLVVDRSASRGHSYRLMRVTIIADV